jgi:sugar phosphate isomerase/epimerase
MQSFFVNLPLRYIAKDRWYIDQFIERRLAPELGLDTLIMSGVDDSWHRDLAKRLTAAHLPCAVHLPFFDLQPGSLDDFILEATRKRLESVKRISEMYMPVHLVAHAGYTGLYVEFYDEWLKRARETWARFMDGWPGHPPLFLENVYEKSTQPLVDLFAGLSGHNTGMCFDTGHWHSFSGGNKAGTVREWVTQLKGFIRHLHVHDNDGSCDQHLGLGQGAFPWDDFFGALAENAVRHTMTLEPHTPHDMEESLEFIKKHPEWFA